MPPSPRSPASRRARGAAVVLWSLSALALCGCGRFGLGVGQEGGVADGDLDGDLDGGDAEGIPRVTDDLVAGDDDGGALPRLAGFAALATKLAAPVSFAGATAVDDGIYVAGGGLDFASTTSCSDEVFAFFPASGALSSVRRLAIANQGLQLLPGPGATLYVVMGFCGSAPEEEARTYLLDLGAGSLDVVGSFGDGMYHFGSGLLRGSSGDKRIVAAAGYGSGPLTDMVQHLDPLTGDASRLTAVFPSKRCMTASAVSGGVLYSFGGLTEATCTPAETAPNDTTLDEIVAVQLEPERVEVVGSLPRRLAGSCAVTRADGTILLFGGQGYVDEGGSYALEPLASVLVFDPATYEVVQHEARLPEARTGLACAATREGEIYLLGGAGPTLAVTDEILLFEPYARSSTAGGPPVDSGGAGTRWTEAFVESDVPSGTNIALSVRIGDLPDREPDDPVGWVAVGLGGALPAGLAEGRYLEWRAELSTSDPRVSPRLLALSFSYVPR